MNYILITRCYDKKEHLICLSLSHIWFIFSLTLCSVLAVNTFVFEFCLPFLNASKVKLVFLISRFLAALEFPNQSFRFNWASAKRTPSMCRWDRF